MEILKRAFVRLGARIAEQPIRGAAWLPWRIRFQDRIGAAGTARKETQDGG